MPQAGFPGDGPIEVEVLTPRTMLIPEELFTPERACELLAAAGLPVPANEQTVCSAAHDGIIAIMAADGQVLRQIDQTLGERARYTTPLLSTSTTNGPTVRLNRCGGLLYTKVYNTGLRFAEVIPASTDADVLYFIERLGGVFRLQEHTLRLEGSQAHTLRKLIGKRFKEVLCE